MDGGTLCGLSRQSGRRICLHRASGAVPGAFLADFLERLAGCREHSILAGVMLPTLHRDVDVMRIDFQRPSLAADALRRDQYGAAAGEGIKHKAIAPRAVLDRVGHKGDRLDGRVHRELFDPARLEAVHPRIVPDVRPMPAVLAKLESVDVGRAAALPNEHQFMLGAVKASHSGIGLVPDTNVLELAVHRVASSKHLQHVAPVHANLMNGAIRGVDHQVPEYRLQKADEFRLAHLSAAHRKVGMADTPEPADVAINWYVVRWVREDEFRFVQAQQLGVTRNVPGIGAQQTVRSKLP